MLDVRENRQSLSVLGTSNYRTALLRSEHSTGGRRLAGYKNVCAPRKRHCPSRGVGTDRTRVSVRAPDEKLARFFRAFGTRQSIQMPDGGHKAT